MKRNPTIHITFDDFVEILKREGIKGSAALATRIFTKAVPINIKDRYIVNVSTQAQAKKVRRIIAANSSKGVTPERLNRILFEERTRAKHHNPTAVRKDNTSQWTLLKEICGLAADFAKEFDMEPERGARRYIAAGLTFMKRQYNLAKFKYLDSKIRVRHQCRVRIDNDKTPDKTIEFYDCFQKLHIQYINVERHINTVEEYVEFVYGKEDADAVNASYEDWLAAMFDSMKQFSKSLYLSSMSGETALKTYYAYMSVKRKKDEAVANVVNSFVSNRTRTFQEEYEIALKRKA